jgi:hypothetical protein
MFFITSFTFSQDAQDAQEIERELDIASSEAAAVDTENKESEYLREVPPPEEILESVLASEDFGKEKEVWAIRLKEKKDDEAEKADDETIAPWVKILRKISAILLRIFVVAILAALIFVLVFLVKRHKTSMFLHGKTKTEIINTEKKLSIKDLLREAESLYTQGFTRNAWSKCFQVSIMAYENKNIKFPQNATPFECLNLVKKQVPNEYGTYNVFIQNWVRIAYADCSLPPESFKNALSYCETLILQGKSA